MVALFRQVNKAGTLCLLMMTAGFTACNNDNDGIGAGTRPDQVMLMACPPDYHEPIEKQVHVPAKKMEPIIIKARHDSSMSLINHTGNTISTQELTIEVQAKDPLRLTLGNEKNVNNGARRQLSSICGPVLIQTNGSIKFTIKDIDISSELVTLPLHFHLIIQGSGIETINQEVIYTL
jgi:hypothetical protein